jgi:hypothetical protein
LGTAKLSRTPGTIPVAGDAAFQRASAAVTDASLPEDRLLALVDEMARDRNEAATDVLVAAAESPSVMVSMAGIRGLRGRPCARVSGPLVRRLAQGEWQRRAWAAKVLGENRCRDSAAALESRLARERDRRVRRQLSQALAALGTGAAG